ncbi:MAG TPA: NADH-quinone oxidoreductase subunit NuoB [Blastocatellia bacterium]|nr:NADH-quinone oxidoreductase subunit NuoB [Blastocatellia bacterium]
MTSLFKKIFSTPVVTERLQPNTTDNEIIQLAGQIDQRARRLFGRSLHIRAVDAGSCNGCEIEITAMNNPYYDLERFGLHFVASPRFADCLLVTGPVTINMADPLRRTFDATPEPKIVIAVGDCARDCGVFAGGYGVFGPVSAVVPVDVVVAGCPPTPAQIIAGILNALGRAQQTR